MKRSRERILTTHAGSLARPDALRALLTARDDGASYDAAALATQVREAVVGVVRQQIAVGLDVINEGEQSKRNFTTYARERLGGIEERVLRPGQRVLAQIYRRDAAEFPEYFAGRGKYARCVGRDNVIAGTDCGLGPRVGHPKIAWAKFEALVEGARLATTRLWGR